MTKGPERYNVSQAARYLDCGRQTVLRWRRRGLLADRATWTRDELDAAAASKPPKAPNPKRASSPSSGPRSMPTQEEPGQPLTATTTGEEPSRAEASQASDPGSASSTTHDEPERDPLQLNLPKPIKGGADVRTRGAGEAAQAEDPGQADEQAPPSPSPDAGEERPTLFGRWRRPA